MSEGGAKYVVVVVDYFTKWVEPEPLATITVKKIITFFSKEHNHMVQDTSQDNFK